MTGSAPRSITTIIAYSLLATVWLPTALLAEGADCDRWTLDGYRLGMTVDEASDVRPMKEKRGLYSTKQKGRFRGFLRFDDDGRLVEWLAVYKGATHDDLRNQIAGRLGEPVVDEEHRGSNQIGPKFWTAWETDWIGPDCQAIVRLRREHTKVYATGDVLQVDREQAFSALVAPAAAPEIDWDLLK